MSAAPEITAVGGLGRGAGGIRTLRQLYAAAEPRVRRAFLRGLARTNQLVTLEQLAEQLAVGQLDTVLTGVEDTAREMADALTAEYQRAGVNAAAVLSDRLPETLRFDLLNERGAATLRETRSRLVRELTREARATTNRVLQSGVQRGLAPVNIAREVRGSIGLTSEQAGYVDNYRRQLERGSRSALERALRDRRFDPSVDRVAREGGSLGRSRIDRMVERYRERWVAHRANVIAQTEALQAVNQGDRALWDQAVSERRVRAEDVTQTWHVSGIPVVRDSHAAMEGQTVGLEESFISGLGNRLRFPGDMAAPAEDVVFCRCVVERSVRRAA